MVDGVGKVTKPVGGIAGGVQGGISGGIAGPSVGATDEQSKRFGDVLSDIVVGRSTRAHHEADELATQFAAGANIDPHQLAIATAKAGLEIQMATKTISQATSAIRTLMNMQI